MHAVEFKTVADGNTIHIPEEYAEFDSQSVKVILMMEPENKSQKKRKTGTDKDKIFKKITTEDDQKDSWLGCLEDYTEIHGDIVSPVMEENQWEVLSK